MRSGPSRAAVVAAVLLALAAGATRSRAQHPADKSEARAAFALAEKAYALGKFEEALQGFERAYELSPLPGLLFNIGQCHRNLGNWERASFFYQGYLAREPQARNADKVQALIGQMQQKVREQEEARARAAAVAPVAPGPVEAAPAPVVPPAAAGPATAVLPASPPAPAASSSPPAVTAAALAEAPAAATRSTPVYKRWWLWTIVGVVVVGAAAGITAASLDPSVSTDNLAGSLGGPIDARR